MNPHYAESEVQGMIMMSIWFIILIIFVMTFLKGSHELFDWFELPFPT